MEVKVVVVVVTVTVTVTVVTVTVTVVTISFWRGPAHPACSRPPPIKVKSKVTHFGGGVFHFFAVFGPNGQRGTTSADNFSTERPFSWRLPHPLLPTVVRKLFTQLFGRFPTFTFSRTTIFFRKSEF